MIGSPNDKLKVAKRACTTCRQSKVRFVLLTVLDYREKEEFLERAKCEMRGDYHYGFLWIYYDSVGGRDTI